MEGWCKIYGSILILDVQVKSENPELKKHMNVEDLFEYLSLCPSLISFTTHILQLYSKYKLRILLRPELKFYINCTNSILQVQL